MSRIRRLLRVLVYGLATFIVLVLVGTVFERVAWAGKVLPGVQLAGASVSGKAAGTVTDEVAAAAARLEREEIQVRAAGRSLTLDPRRIELRIDPADTTRSVQDAGRTGNPLGQLVGTVLRVARPDEVMWVASWDEDALDGVIAEWEQEVAADATDGTLQFDGASVVPVPPKPGQVLARPAADHTIVEALRSGVREGIELPIRALRPKITRSEVERAAEEARALLTAPVTVRLRDVTVELAPLDVARMLQPEPKGASLRLTIDHEELRAALGDEIESLEGPPEDARFVVEGTKVEIVPHRVGTQVDLGQIADEILRGTSVVEADLTEKEPDTTTEELESLGIEELVSSFTSRYPSGQARVTNIHRAAEIVDETIVTSGQVFSLNETIGKRTLERGFVRAPVIYAGEFTEDIGGGTSQFATAFFNAVFFGGYPIVEYQAHTFYISRYPMGREATLSWPNPDLRFKNDTTSAILIRTSVSASSVTVNFYSRKIRTVEALGPDVVETIPIPEEYEADPSVERGQQKVKEAGSEGRVVRVTRVVKDLDGEEDGRRVFTTRYRPQKRIIAVHPCDHPDEAERPPPEQCQQETTTTTAPGATTTTTAPAA